MQQMGAEDYLALAAYDLASTDAPFSLFIRFQGIPHPVPYGDESNPRALTFLGSRSLYIT